MTSLRKTLLLLILASFALAATAQSPARIRATILEPNTTMTNGYVGTVSSAGGQEVVLDYKGGTQKISVPAGTPIVTNVPADRSYLKSGEYIFTVAQTAADGTMTVQRVAVSKDGVRPPQ